MQVSWIALADRALASWEASIPPDRLLAFARALIAAGGRHDVFKVVTVSEEGRDPERFDYVAHLERGAPPFALAPEEAPPGRRFTTPGRICWVTADGELTEGDVGEVGALLARLRPDTLDWAERFMAHTAPVEVWATGDRVRIDLQTDLWFPRVIGILDGDAPPAPAPPDRDNEAPARCHTPRLNAFLEELRQSALSLGGQWQLRPAEGIGTRYAAMTGEQGVTLEAPVQRS
jgi:hypothetical protein